MYSVCDAGTFCNCGSVIVKGKFVHAERDLLQKSAVNKPECKLEWHSVERIQLR